MKYSGDLNIGDEIQLHFGYEHWTFETKLFSVIRPYFIIKFTIQVVPKLCVLRFCDYHTGVTLE